MLTRRRVLALLPPSLTALASRVSAQNFFPHRPKPASPLLPIYIGQDTSRDGAKGIMRAQFNPATGEISTPQLAAACVAPSFLALNQVRGRRLLYACNEGHDAASSTISTYVIDPGTGALTLLGQVPAGGAGPCFVSVDATGRSVYVADYAGGAVASYHVLPDGRLTAPADIVDFRSDPRLASAQLQPGPLKERQDGPHPHSATISPDNRFLLVNDLGDDAILIFPINPETARLGTANALHTRLPGSGPRHVVFHPNGRWVYGINELNNRVNLYLWDTAHATKDHPAQATLTNANEPISTLMTDFRGVNTAAEIAIDSSGRFIYASNRGEDSLVVFAVDPDNGSLNVVQRSRCGGYGPRHFTFDPSQRWLVCGNQGAGTVSVFARDPQNGRLNGPVFTLPIEGPMYTLFA